MNNKTKNTLSLYMVYSLPAITTAWLTAPIYIIQGVYAKYYGLSLTTIAAVILATRLFDAVSDPVIGYWSDRHLQRAGTRKPFMLVGGLLLIVSGYFLYVPVDFSTQRVLDVGALERPANVDPLYFIVWFLIFYLAWTLFEIPHITWAGELAKTAQQKTKIYSFRQLAGYLGLVLFYVVPLLPFFETSEITPNTLQVSVIAASLLMLIFLVICLQLTPNGDDLKSLSQQRKNSVRTPVVKVTKTDFRKFWQSITRNKPFLIFICAYLFAGIGAGMWYGLIFIYVDTYLKLGESFAQMFLLAFAVGLAATPVWYKLAIWWDKKNTWILATVLAIVSFIYTGTLHPSETGFNQLAMLKVIQTLGFTCVGIIAPAILSEIADYSAWKYGAARAATYFSIYTFIGKSNSAVATALGLSIAGLYGFDATAAEHSEHSIFGLTMAISWLPPIFSLIALVFIVLLSINTRRHSIIRRRLDSRESRLIKIDNSVYLSLP